MTEILGTASIMDLRHGAFLRGAASAFNLSGNSSRFMHFADSAQEADDSALQNDLEVIAADAIKVLKTA